MSIQFSLRNTLRCSLFQNWVCLKYKVKHCFDVGYENRTNFWQTKNFKKGSKIKKVSLKLCGGERTWGMSFGSFKVIQRPDSQKRNSSNFLLKSPKYI